MRLATVLWDRQPAFVLVIGERAVHVGACARTLRRKGLSLPADVLSLIAGGPKALRAVRDLSREASQRLNEGAWRARPRDPMVRTIDRVTFLPPIPRPPKNIFCIGRNYAEHAKERGAEVPPVPVFFTKPPTSIIGHEGPVVYHKITGQLDYEVELAVVIGRQGRDIPKEKAYDYIFGYTILNDITARDLQKRHLQWFKGKGLDTFCPMGPWIVHKSVIPDPHNLRISLRVNGDTRQAGNTSDMVFKIPDLIEVLSAGMTLEPGDILATGTPSGVAAAFDPPKWLKPGDIVEAEIEGIGVLRNTIASP